jgi:hypothetical protein
MKPLFRLPLISCAAVLLLSAGASRASACCWPIHVIGLLRQCGVACHARAHKLGGMCCPASGGEAAPSADEKGRAFEQIPEPKRAADAKSPDSGPLFTTQTPAIAPSNPEIAARIKAWVGEDVTSGPVQRVEIQVDGKTVVLEIRVGTSGTGPVGVPNKTLADALKTALAKETVADPVKAAGRRQLTELFDGVVKQLNDGKDHSITGTLKFIDQLLQLRSEAKQLLETNKAIKSFLDDQLKGIDPGMTLSAKDLTKVSDAFKTVAETLRGLP